MLKPYFVVLFTVDNAFYHNLSRFHYKLKARMGAVSAYSTVNEVSINDAKKSAYVCRLSTEKKEPLLCRISTWVKCLFFIVVLHLFYTLVQ